LSSFCGNLAKINEEPHAMPINLGRNYMTIVDKGKQTTFNDFENAISGGLSSFLTTVQSNKSFK
jgi:hypothetical protein